MAQRVRLYQVPGPNTPCARVVQQACWASACSSFRKGGVRFVSDWSIDVRKDQLFKVPLAVCCRHCDVETNPEGPLAVACHTRVLQYKIS